MNFAQLADTYIKRTKLYDEPRNLLSFNGGDIVPIFCDEAYPGDTYSVGTKMFLRFSSALVAPIFDNLYVDTFWFFVPNRLIWSHWENFMGESDTPYDPDVPSSTDYLVPIVTAPSGGFGKGSLPDYFNVRPYAGNLWMSALPLRAYNLIYNEWFRPEWLVDSVVVPSGDTDNINNYKVLKRAKRADYFTRSLPWPQRGPSVSLNLAGQYSYPVVGNGMSLGLTNGTNNYGLYFQGSAASLRGATNSYGQSVASGVSDQNSLPNMSIMGVTTDPTKSGLVAQVDLSENTAITVNSLRNLFQVQKLYERDARGGTRYTEILRSHFGVVSPDARLQRPEYLGGNSTRMQINTVVQNSSSVDNSPLGNLGAFGVAGSKTHGFTKSFLEHGFVIGLVNVRADLTYQQGIPRKFTRRTRLDYYWPTFAHLGEQAVLQKEIYATGDDSQDELVFGYQERYAELRYYPSQVCGELRSDYSNSLDVWHLSQDFTDAPTLSPSFIENPAQEVLDRVLQVKSNVSDQIIGDFEFQLTRIRPLPMFGTPGLVDHF